MHSVQVLELRDGFGLLAEIAGAEEAGVAGYRSMLIREQRSGAKRITVPVKSRWRE
jgi:hypothetical protein